MSTVPMSPPRSLAKTVRAVIRLEADRYQCAAEPRLPAAVKWSASSAAEPQSLIDATGFHAVAWRPRLSIHDVSRSSGPKTQTVPPLVRFRAVSPTSSPLVEAATADP